MSIKRHSVWWEASPPDFSYQSQLPTHADVIIIGAGFAGVSTAFWLSKLMKDSNKPFRIIILEEAPHAAFKGTGRMNGSVYLGSNRPAALVAEALSENIAHKLYRYSATNNSLLHSILRQVDCGAEFNGGFRMASTAKEVVELEDSKKLLEKWGFHPIYFDHNQSQHVVITPLVKGSLFIPGEGMFDPFRFTNDMARALRLHRVIVAYGARVKLADNAEDGTTRVHLENGHIITGGKVIHTTTNTVPWDRLQEAVVRKRETAVCTHPLSEDLDDMPLPLMPIELNQGLDSVRINERSVVMTGGKAGLKKQDPEVGVRDDSSVNHRILEHLDSTMMRNFPFSNHTEVSHAWSYIETGSQDGLPFVGELPNLGGHYVNAAHGRNKFGLAFLTSKNIAERVLRLKVQDQDFNIFALKRLTRGE